MELNFLKEIHRFSLKIAQMRQISLDFQDSQSLKLLLTLLHQRLSLKPAKVIKRKQISSDQESLHSIDKLCTKNDILNLVMSLNQLKDTVQKNDFFVKTNSKLLQIQQDLRANSSSEVIEHIPPLIDMIKSITSKLRKQNQRTVQQPPPIIRKTRFQDQIQLQASEEQTQKKFIQKNQQKKKAFRQKFRFKNSLGDQLNDKYQPPQPGHVETFVSDSKLIDKIIENSHSSNDINQQLVQLLRQKENLLKMAQDDIEGLQTRIKQLEIRESFRSMTF